METDHSFRLPVPFNQTIRHHISEDDTLPAKRRATDSGFGPPARAERQRENEGNKVTSVARKMAADRRGDQHDKSVPNYISCY